MIKIFLNIKWKYVRKICWAEFYLSGINKPPDNEQEVIQNDGEYTRMNM